jgi:hypothetical protein
MFLSAAKTLALRWPLSENLPRRGRLVGGFGHQRKRRRYWRRSIRVIAVRKGRGI